MVTLVLPRATSHGATGTPPVKSVSSLWQRRQQKIAELTGPATTGLRIDSNAIKQDLGPIRTAKISDAYDIGDVIGQGGLSVVYRGTRKSDGEEVTLKIVRTTDDEIVENARAEFGLLKRVNHPHIARVLDFLVVADRTALVLSSFRGSNLRDAVETSPEKRFSEESSCGLFLALLHAVYYLHENQIVHRDVKPENVLVSKDLKDLQLIDFNIARYIPEGDALLSPWCTRLYAAPEVSSGSSPDLASDVWGAGICLSLMISGHGISEYAETGSIWSMLPPISDDCKTVLQQCLALQCSKRADARTLLLSSWFDDYKPDVCSAPLTCQLSALSRSSSPKMTLLAVDHLASPRMAMDMWKRQVTPPTPNTAKLGPLTTMMARQVTPSVPAEERLATLFARQISPVSSANAGPLTTMTTTMAWQVTPSTPAEERLATLFARQISPVSSANAAPLTTMTTRMAWQVTPSTPAEERLAALFARQLSPASSANAGHFTTMMKQLTPPSQQAEERFDNMYEGRDMPDPAASADVEGLASSDQASLDTSGPYPAPPNGMKDYIYCGGSDARYSSSLSPKECVLSPCSETVEYIECKSPKRMGAVD